jgi:hypothetical protein
MPTLFIIALLISFWLVPTTAVSQQPVAHGRAEEIAASFNKQKNKLKQKAGGKQERYYRKFSGEPVIRQNITAYSGTYEMPGLGFTINLQIGDDGRVEASGFEPSTGSTTRKARRFRLENARVEGALLTGTKVYEDGMTERFEGVFMNRTEFTSPTGKGTAVFGLGVVGVSVEFAGVVFQKLFYELK